MAIPYAMPRMRRRVQQRSAVTVEAILDAAERVIAENGVARASVQEIAHRAGVTTGAIYGRFENKEALLYCMFERQVPTWDRFEALAVEIESGKLGFRRSLERCMEVMLWLYRDNGDRIRALNHAMGASKELKRRVLKSNSDICQRLYRALDVYRSKIRHPRPALALKLGHEAGMRLLRSSVLHEEIDYSELRAQGIEVDDALLVREAARIWEAYLTSRG